MRNLSKLNCPNIYTHKIIQEAFEIATDDSVGVNYHDISTYQLETK